MWLVLLLAATAWMLMKPHSSSLPRMIAAHAMTALPSPSRPHLRRRTGKPFSGEQRLADLHARRDADVKAALTAQGLALGDPVFIRIVKESRELELWLKPATRCDLHQADPDLPHRLLLRHPRPQDQGRRPAGARGLLRHRAQAHEPGQPVSPRLQHRATPMPMTRRSDAPAASSWCMGRSVSVGCFAMTAIRSLKRSTSSLMPR